jgi:hypothetical protein
MRKKISLSETTKPFDRKLLGVENCKVRFFLHLLD